MKTYIKFLSRNKLYTAIEAIGLILSMGFAILIGNYVYLHTSIAYENPDWKRTYMLNRDRMFYLGNKDKDVIDSSIPEVELCARVSGGTTNGTRIEGNSYAYTQFFADPEFFELFPYYEFVVGSAEVFYDRSNVIVSESFANRIASSPEEALGKQFSFSSMGLTENLTVAAVIEDFENTLFPYVDIIFNYKLREEADSMLGEVLTAITVFRVKEGSVRSEIEEKIIGQCAENYEKFFITKDKLKIRNLSEAYLCDEAKMINHGDRGMLNLLTIVVIAILVSAVFNYVNLSYALSGKRAREMATRKLVGAGKEDIFRSNISESIIFTLISFSFALIFALAMEPLFNRLISGFGTKWYIPVEVQFSFGYILIYLLSAIFLGILAGALPSLNASNFKAIDVIKGQFRLNNKRIFSKIFIVVQSAIAVVFISISITMEAQLHHMIHRPMNMNTENIFMLKSAGRYELVLADELRKLPFVKKIGFTNTVPGHSRLKTQLYGQNGEGFEVSYKVWDSTYFKMVNPKIVKDYSRALNNSLWLSESAATALENGQDLEMRSVESLQSFLSIEADHIGGIMADTPNNSASSLSFDGYSMAVVKNFSPSDDFILAIETDSQSKEYKTAIMEVHDRIAAGSGIESYSTPFSDYLSDIHRSQLETEERTIRLVEIFMILSVLLSLLGLLAMSTYFSEQKSKEIAIRKVFGGSILTETLANVKSYMIMVLVACVIGTPIAVFAAKRYLEQFAYRIENYWWIFVLAVALSFVISLASVLWQTLRAAHTNPATELKKE